MTSHSKKNTSGRLAWTQRMWSDAMIPFMGEARPCAVQQFNILNSSVHQLATFLHAALASRSSAPTLRPNRACLRYPLAGK